MIRIRGPKPGDEDSIQNLLKQLGYNVTPYDVQRRLETLTKRACDPVLLAVDEESIIGLIAIHWTPMLFSALPVARITTLVVHEQARGRGVGRILVEAGANLAEQAG